MRLTSSHQIPDNGIGFLLYVDRNIRNTISTMYSFIFKFYQKFVLRLSMAFLFQSYIRIPTAFEVRATNEDELHVRNADDVRKY